LILEVASKLKKTKTVIFISHSSRVIEFCDEVYDLTE
jgi:ABC-type lipoprotein export system ATPase subunit